MKRVCISKKILILFIFSIILFVGILFEKVFLENKKTIQSRASAPHNNILSSIHKTTTGGRGQPCTEGKSCADGLHCYYKPGYFRLHEFNPEQMWYTECLDSTEIQGKELYKCKENGTCDPGLVCRDLTFFYNPEYVEDLAKYMSHDRTNEYIDYIDNTIGVVNNFKIEYLSWLDIGWYVLQNKLTQFPIERYHEPLNNFSLSDKNNELTPLYTLSKTLFLQLSKLYKEYDYEFGYFMNRSSICIKDNKSKLSEYLKNETGKPYKYCGAMFSCESGSSCQNYDHPCNNEYIVGIDSLWHDDNYLNNRRPYVDSDEPQVKIDLKEEERVRKKVRNSKNEEQYFDSEGDFENFSKNLHISPFPLTYNGKNVFNSDLGNRFCIPNKDLNDHIKKMSKSPDYTIDKNLKCSNNENNNHTFIGVNYWNYLFFGDVRSDHINFNNNATNATNATNSIKSTQSECGVGITEGYNRETPIFNIKKNIVCGGADSIKACDNMNIYSAFAYQDSNTGPFICLKDTDILKEWDNYFQKNSNTIKYNFSAKTYYEMNNLMIPVPTYDLKGNYPLILNGEYETSNHSAKTFLVPIQINLDELKQKPLINILNSKYISIYADIPIPPMINAFRINLESISNLDINDFPIKVQMNCGIKNMNKVVVLNAQYRYDSERNAINAIRVYVSGYDEYTKKTLAEQCGWEWGKEYEPRLLNIKILKGPFDRNLDLSGTNNNGNYFSAEFTADFNLENIKFTGFSPL